jgi:hypothetical protein
MRKGILKYFVICVSCVSAFSLSGYITNRIVSNKFPFGAVAYTKDKRGRENIFEAPRTIVGVLKISTNKDGDGDIDTITEFYISPKGRKLKRILFREEDYADNKTLFDKGDELLSSECMRYKDEISKWELEHRNK